MRYRAVLFDLGGVVVGSPLEAIARYEAEQGIPGGFVNRVVAATGAAGAWSRLERGELTLEAFYPAFEQDCAAAGHAIDARAMMARGGHARRHRREPEDGARPRDGDHPGDRPRGRAERAGSAPWLPPRPLI